MNDQERKAELRHLADVLQHVNSQLSIANEYCAQSRSGLKDSLAGFWENTGRNNADTAQYIEAIERQKSLAAFYEKQRRQLERMANSPYFGRIDFQEHGKAETEQIYIGIATLTDETSGRLLVYDWRTPVASMFYDFERGAAWYLCPAGKITGEITLKRQYKIANGVMVYLFDADLKIDDELLQELLSKNVDEHMHTIVTSIQREQNQIIRNAGQHVLFVSGPAGSGKTSIALHRVAYLLYRDRETITARNVLILSPNHIFSEYIAGVLPEIGEENVARLTFQDCLDAAGLLGPLRMESRNEQLEQLFSQTDNTALAIRAASISYKSSAAFHRILCRYSEYLAREFTTDFPDIEIAGQVLFSQAEWQTFYQNTYASLPPARRLTKIKELIFRRLQPAVQAMRKQKAAEIAAAGEAMNAKTISALARIAVKRQLEPLYRRIEQFTTLEPLRLYQRLFTDDSLFAKCAADTAIPPAWPKIKHYTLQCLRDGWLPHEDTFPFACLKGMLTGFAERREIKHLVIDEAQDYTPIQYAILARLFPQCSWTVLGDPAQTVHPYLQPVPFAAAAKIIRSESPAFYELRRSYRSTRQIQAFCQALLPSAAVVQPLQRDGPVPQVIYVQSDHLLTPILVKTIQDLQADGQQFIAIIAKSVSECRHIYNSLHNQVKLLLISSEDDDFRRGPIVLPAYLAKGLEFDAVIAVRVDAAGHGQAADRQLLYTVCTRALHRLILCTAQHPSSLLSTIDPRLYSLIC